MTRQIFLLLTHSISYPAAKFRRIAKKFPEVNIKCASNTEKCIDGGEPLFLFHAHHHCVAEAGARCHLKSNGFHEL